MLGAGLGINRRKLFISEGELFINAATAAGYSGGSASCADETFNSLKAIPALGYAQAKAFFDLADAEGYSNGDLFCSEENFTTLIDIA